MSAIQVAAAEALDAALLIQEEIKSELRPEWVAAHGPIICSAQQAMCFIHREWHDLVAAIRTRNRKKVAKAMTDLAGVLLKCAADVQNSPQNVVGIDKSGRLAIPPKFVPLQIQGDTDDADEEDENDDY